MRDLDQEERWFRIFEGMRIAAPFLVPVLALLILLAVASCAGAVECVRSADAVKAAHPGLRPTWSGRVPGHQGERCWMTNEERKEVVRNGKSRTAVSGSARNVERPARATRAALQTRAAADTAETAATVVQEPPRWSVADRCERTDRWAGDQGLERGLLLTAAKLRLAKMMAR
jgi:hypothetical protein